MENSFDRTEGREKLKKMVEEIGTCMFLTTNKLGNQVRPMATTRIDGNGTVWFFTQRSSNKMKDLSLCNNVELFYSHPTKDAYLHVRGKAYPEHAEGKIKELWSPIVKAWFPEGIDDPEICLLKVDIDSAYHWDSGTSKMVSFFKMVAAVITGNQVKEGEEGALIR